jgi:alpha-beta hydrolase superfamily lysophospholipase
MMRRAWTFALLVALGAGPARGVTPGGPLPGASGRPELPHEAVTFKTPDGVRLAGWWFPGPPHAHAVVMAPRGAGTMANLLEATKAMHDLGFSVLTFDLRDFGPGRPGPADSLRYVVLATRWVTDMVAALDYARGRVDSSARVLAWGGHDLPSMVAIAAAARDPHACDALAIEGVPRSTEDVMRRSGTLGIPEAIRQQRFKVMMRDQPAYAAAALEVPVLLLAGGRDTVVTPRDAQAVIASGRGRHDQVLFPRGGHEDLERMPDYFERIAAWFKRMAGYQRRSAPP